MALTEIKTSGIADDAVTTDKLANAINTARDANTAKATNATHTGDVTGSGSLTIADNAVTLAKMASGTDGQIITYDASGDPIAVGPGTDGQVLTSTGAGSPPAFEDLPAKAALTGSTNNQITTVTGANAIQGEANLTFDGTTLAATGAMSLSGTADPVTITVQNTDSNTATDSGGDIVFKGSKTNGDPLYFGGIGGRRRNQGSDETGYLALYRQNGDGSNAAVEALRIDHAGKVLINTTDVPSQGADTFTVKAPDGGNAGITIRTGTGNTGNIFFSDGTSGSGEYAGYIYYAHGTDKLHFGMDAADRLVIGSGGDIEVKTGNVVIGTAGKGIDFSAQTQSTSTTDDELLDHYEKGKWTPVVKKNGGDNAHHTNGGTPNVIHGRYIRVGKLVWLSCYCQWNSGSNTEGQSGGWQIEGLPFALQDDDPSTCRIYQSAPSGYFVIDGTDFFKLNTTRWQVNYSDKLDLYTGVSTADQAWTTGGFRVAFTGCFMLHE